MPAARHRRNVVLRGDSLLSVCCNNATSLDPRLGMHLIHARLTCKSVVSVANTQLSSRLVYCNQARTWSYVRLCMPDTRHEYINACVSLRPAGPATRTMGTKFVQLPCKEAPRDTTIYLCEPRRNGAWR